jgi:hypothetical protein
VKAYGRAPLVLIIGQLFFGQAIASAAFEQLARPWGRGLNVGGLELSAAVSLFETTGYFDLDGEKQPMFDGDEFRMIQTDLDARYGVGPRFEVRGGLRLRQNSSVNNLDEVSKSGPESGMVGMRLLFPNTSAWDYSFDLEARTTFYTNDLYTSQTLPADELVLGDSGASFKLGGFLSYASETSFILNSSLHYHKTPSNLSDELLYRVEGLFPFERLVLGGGIQGIQSLNQDDFEQVPENKEKVAQGASAQFNSINRSSMSPYFKIGYAFERVSLLFEASKVMSGKSTDEGNRFLLALNFATGGQTASQMRIDRFKEYFIEASVIRVSPRAKFLKIDKGMAADVRKGMRVDIFQTDFFGGNVLVASGIIYEVEADSAIVRLEKRFNDREIKQGFTARAR